MGSPINTNILSALNSCIRWLNSVFWNHPGGTKSLCSRDTSSRTQGLNSPPRQTPFFCCFTNGHIVHLITSKQRSLATWQGSHWLPGPQLCMVISDELILHLTANNINQDFGNYLHYTRMVSIKFSTLRMDSRRACFLARFCCFR